VCASQRFEVLGLRGENKFLPHLLGHEGFGIVEDIGPEVSRFKIGDRVILTWIKQDGIESDKISYIGNGDRRVNSGKVATFSEYAVVSENRLFHAPLSDPKILPLLGCAALTGSGMALELNCSSSRALVVGAGGVGIFTVLQLLSQAIQEIHVVDTSSSRLEKIRQIAENIKLYEGFSDFEFVEEVRKNGRFQEVYESTGSVVALEEAFSFVSTPGTLIFASHPEEGKKIAISPHELIQGKNIRGSWGGGCADSKKRSIAVETFIQWKDFLPNLISRPISLFDINEVFYGKNSATAERVLMDLSV